MSTTQASSQQPERAKRNLPDRGSERLSAGAYARVFVRAGKEALDDHVTSLAAALAYYAFLAIPSLLPVAVGAFGLFAGPEDVSSIVQGSRASFQPKR
jgi:uncharacterized BrkB/YihY/UPF0761 family membrane protein